MNIHPQLAAAFSPAVAPAIANEPLGAPPAAAPSPAAVGAPPPPPLSHEEFTALREELTPILSALSQDGMSVAGQKSASEQLSSLFDKYLGDTPDGPQREAKLKSLAAVAIMQSNVLATREMFAIRNAKMQEWYDANPPSAAPVGARVENPYADYVDPKNREGMRMQKAFLSDWVSGYARAHRIDYAGPGSTGGVLVNTLA